MLGEYLSAAVGAVSPGVVEHRLLGWISRYGLQFIFGAQVLGIVGLPMPDELMLTMAGTLVRAGRLPLLGTLVAAQGGALVGITVSYLAGRYIGLAALRKIVHIPDDLLRRVEHWFHRAGGWLLTFGYFIPGVRHVTAIAAGSSGLGYGTFAAFAYPGGDPLVVVLRDGRLRARRAVAPRLRGDREKRPPVDRRGGAGLRPLPRVRGGALVPAAHRAGALIP